MDLKRLRTFVTIAEQGTVSKAAMLLRVTQPALSRQISGFEDELGFKLFDRVGRRLALTPRGEQLLDDAAGVLSYVATLTERAGALRRGDVQRLRVAAAPVTIEPILPGFLRRFADGVPGVRLELMDVAAADHLATLERGAADLAVSVTNLLTIDEARFRVRVLSRFHLWAACSPTLGIEPTDTIDIGSLIRHPLLLLDSGFATRNIFDAACHLAHVRPKVSFESSGVHCLLDLARVGHGVAVIPSIMRAKCDGLQLMTITHRRQPLRLTLAVVWDTRRIETRYAEIFAELLADHIDVLFADLPDVIPGPRNSGAGRRRARSVRRARRPANGSSG